MLDFLKLLTALFEVTTRSNQLTIVNCLSQIVTKWKHTTDPTQAENSQQRLLEIGKLLASALVIPKHAQLSSGRHTTTK